MRLYFVRHGESEANTLHIISNRDRPHGLTPRGIDQARALAGQLKDVPFTALFTSPVLRARQTAHILAEAFGIPLQGTVALREYDCGRLEDRSDEESWKQHRQYYNDWMLCRRYEDKPEGGESFLEIRERFLPFIETLWERNDEHILLVGHGGLFHLMLPLVLTNVDNEFVRQHGLGHTDCVIAERRLDGWQCRQWGDIPLYRLSHK
jgi:2,3-bisphosphoglycerate-dependent phosphoglycerate mutase